MFRRDSDFLRLNHLFQPRFLVSCHNLEAVTLISFDARRYQPLYLGISALTVTVVALSKK